MGCFEVLGVVVFYRHGMGFVMYVCMCVCVYWCYCQDATYYFVRVWLGGFVTISYLPSFLPCLLGIVIRNSVYSWPEGLVAPSILPSLALLGACP